ncbi:MAG: DUF3105 domain-containing protein [Micromonosporaceae bacterium]|jgi:hypothetical protein
MSTRTSRPGGKTQPFGAKGKGKGKPVAPVRVGKDRNWGMIIMLGVVAALALAIIGYAAAGVVSKDTRTWDEIAADIEGIVNYRVERPEMLTRNHQNGPITYEVLPPVGGDHNDTWMYCQGMVYEDPVANERAVHSLEHGAVWVTYRPDLPDDQVQRLADRVDGVDYLFMSPFEGLDAPISLQAWGYQLKVQDADDERIDEFIRALRYNARIENATCGGGTTLPGPVS